MISCWLLARMVDVVVKKQTGYARVEQKMLDFSP